MAFNKNTSASFTSSSSSSSSSVVDEMSEMSLKNTSLDSSDEDFSSCSTDRFLKRQILLNKISDLQYRARERQEEFQTLLERFNLIQESLEWEIEKVEKSMVSMEWLQDFQKTIDEFQANMANNVSRLRENFRKMQEVAAKKVLPVKTKGKPGKEYLDAKVVKSIQSLPSCPTVAEIKANPKAASTYSSNLIDTLNNITKSTSSSPATTRALKLSAGTIENLNKAFQEHCSEMKSLKTPLNESKLAKDVNRNILGTPVHQHESAIQQQKVQKLPALSKRPEADNFAFPQVKEPPERDANVKDLPQERPVATSDKALKDLQRPSADGTFPPAPARAFALPKIGRSVEETKVTVEHKGKVTAFEEEMAQDDASHHPSPVRSFVLPEFSQSVEETKVDVMAAKDLQSPPTHGFHRPQTSQYVKETNVYRAPVEERQSPSPVHTRRPSSAVKLPKIQTQGQPTSLLKSDKPEARKHVSSVSGNIEEQVKDSEEDIDKLLYARTIDPSYVVDVKAQENNLQQLDRAFQNNNISSEMYNLCKGTVSQTLQSVKLRLGCLLRRYIRHVQMKKLRKALEENFKETRNLKDVLKFKKVHSQLCKFDRFQQRVKNIGDAEKASTDETRRLCIGRMAHLYQHVNAVHGLHMTGISCVQKHVSLPLLTVTPVRFSSDLCPSPPRHSQNAPCRTSPARHLQIYPKALYGLKTTRKLPGSSMKISHVEY
ncbi:hypothetical protein Q8A67_015440 [Cirrhinus molitorella]|uniref:Uncharacterized protein n=1 Tax=Cirrhinus molitorella TaxID=172907 RepID=A0AA88TTE6_9TELE|nr:hypothetical protein Q8A67_015440 [Cirrhinus molitorella]